MELLSVTERDRSRALKRVGMLLILCVVMSLLMAVKPQADTIQKFSMRVGQNAQLSIDGVTDSLQLTVIAGKKRVKLRPNGTIKAKKTGTVVIRATYKEQNFRFRIKIKGKKKRQIKELRVFDISLGGAGTAAEDPGKIPRANLNTAVIGAKVPENMIILVGDSRTVGMKATVGGSATWIAKENEGVDWLKSTVIPKLKKMEVDQKLVVFNLGVNDLVQSSTYISVLQSLGETLRRRGATVYFMTVNPVDEKEEAKHGYSVKNQAIVDFNVKLAQALLSSGFGIIDTYDYLVDHSFSTVDGVHYSGATYKTIYSVLCDAIRA